VSIPLVQMVQILNPAKTVIRLRPVEATQSLERELAAIFLWIPEEWSRLIEERLVPFYVQPIDDVMLDVDFQQIITEMCDFINSRIIYQTEKSQRWVTRFGAWHGRRTAAAVRSATGVEVAPYMMMSDIRAILEDAVKNHVSLMRTLNEETRQRVVTVVFRSFALRKTKRELIRELALAMGITQKRARFIAEDQTIKLNAVLNEMRQRQMGFDGYVWRTRRDDRVRREHAQREGHAFKWNDPPYDGHPGIPINCRCVPEAYMELKGGIQHKHEPQRTRQAPESHP